MISDASDRTKTKMKETEEERHKHLVMIGNVLHSTVPVSNNEVCTNRDTLLCNHNTGCALLYSGKLHLTFPLFFKAFNAHRDPSLPPLSNRY